MGDSCDFIHEFPYKSGFKCKHDAGIYPFGLNCSEADYGVNRYKWELKVKWKDWVMECVQWCLKESLGKCLDYNMLVRLYMNQQDIDRNIYFTVHYVLKLYRL